MRRADLILALAGAIALVAAVPHRHPVAGHYRVPGAFYTPPPGSHGSPIVNAHFETGRIDGGWHQCGDVPAYTSMDHPYSGAFSEFSGTAWGSGEPLGNSGVCQQVTIPPNGVLIAELFQVSNEPDASFAFQEADLLDTRGAVVVNLYRTVNDRSGWVRGSWNLGAYSGHTYWLYFGVHGDGFRRRMTQQYVGEVNLTAGEGPRKN